MSKESDVGLERIAMSNRTKELAYWINEREHMRIKKEEGDCTPPFSHDPAMATVRYCNVHREDDKVTRWIAKNWRDINANDDNLVLAMVAARMINWPNTLEEIEYPSLDREQWPFSLWAASAKKDMRAMQEAGLKVWTSAYTISTCGRAMLKEDYVFDHVLAEVATRDFAVAGDASLSTMWARLTSVDGLGSFLGAQIVADLKNTPGHPLSQAPDFWSWSAPGPGSLRGLKAYFGHHVTDKTYQTYIEQCFAEVSPLLYEYVGPLHMQDFQNCLCEFSKYMRVKEGDGRVRNKYTAR